MERIPCQGSVNPPPDERHCVNGSVLRFEPLEEATDEDEADEGEADEGEGEGDGLGGR